MSINPPSASLPERSPFGRPQQTQAVKDLLACLPCHWDTGRGGREHLLPAPPIHSFPSERQSRHRPYIHLAPIDAKHPLQALNPPTAVKNRSRPQDAYRSAFDPLRRHLRRSSSFPSLCMWDTFPIRAVRTCPVLTNTLHLQHISLIHFDNRIVLRALQSPDLPSPLL